MNKFNSLVIIKIILVMTSIIDNNANVSLLKGKRLKHDHC